MSSIVRFDEWQDATGTPVLRFNLGVVEVWDGSAWVPAGAPEFEYVTVGGGAGGYGTGNHFGGGGGGAGGYSAGNIALAPGSSFTVTIGAGGASSTRGAVSVFRGFIMPGGGTGDGGDIAGDQSQIGASGGGGRSAGGAFGITGLGNNGGEGFAGAGNGAGGGGGGASAAGVAATSTLGGNGGAGTASSITGTSVTRGGGGGGGREVSTNNGTGGAGGGGDAGANGTVNTGGGGGGGIGTAGAAGSGGSGVVILKYPDSITLTIGAGLTSSTASAGGFKVTTFTAGTDTVTF
jgi:hypothetical protein